MREVAPGPKHRHAQQQQRVVHAAYEPRSGPRTCPWNRRPEKAQSSLPRKFQVVDASVDTIAAIDEPDRQPVDHADVDQFVHGDAAESNDEEFGEGGEPGRCQCTDLAEWLSLHI
jgi:hypothetical protein